MRARQRFERPRPLRAHVEIAGLMARHPSHGDCGADRLARSVRVLRSRVAELRPVDLSPDRSPRTTYERGEVGQCDYLPAGRASAAGGCPWSTG
jgi:hypothetical protein